MTHKVLSRLQVYRHDFIHTQYCIMTAGPQENTRLHVGWVPLCSVSCGPIGVSSFSLHSVSGIRPSLSVSLVLFQVLQVIRPVGEQAAGG